MRLTLLIIFALLLSRSFGQKLTFDVFLFGDKIGKTVIEKSVQGDTLINYMLNSASEAHIFFTTRKIFLHYDISYKRGQLIYAYSKSVRNDDVHITTLQWQNNCYQLKKHNETICIKPPVDCSTVKLFFEEPCHPGKIFAERSGEFHDLKKTGPGEYELDMPEGLTYIYRYKAGKLVELEMRKGFLGSAFLRPATIK